MQALRRRLATAPRRPWPDRPVPVTLVITELDVGGAERALVSLATGLDCRRWAPTVIALGPEGDLAAPLRAAGIAVECLHVDRRRPVGAVLRLARALRAGRPALVQSFLFHANLAVRLAAPLAGRPWVVGGIRVAERDRRRHLTLDRHTQRLAAGEVCVSDGVRDFSIGLARLDPERLAVIPNGIDPEPFDRAEPADRAALGLAEPDRIALFVGRLERQKGVPVLLDAFEQIAPERPDWRLLLVGDGPDRVALRGRIAASPILQGRARMLGRRGDVPALLKAADLVVLPSLWEGMPNVVLEAMAARRAVVATAVEGSRDLVAVAGPGRSGWLVPPGDPVGLAAALREATAAPDRLAAFGAAGRAIVAARFTRTAVIAAYEGLWAGLLGLEHPARP